MSDNSLPSWNDGPTKQAILDFVAAVTAEGGDQFVSEADRVAVFDNDGCLWTEQPLYAQAYFALDQIKTLASQHPEWQSEQPFAAILANDQEAMKQFSEEDIGRILAAAHSGMTTDEFDAQARAWAESAKQPADRPPVHRIGLPTAARTARLPARQRLYDLHRLRRWHRPVAHVLRGGLRRPIQSGDRQQRQGHVLAGGRRAHPDQTPRG